MDPRRSMRRIPRGALLVLAGSSALFAASALGQSPQRTTFDDDFDRNLRELASPQATVRKRALAWLEETPDWRMTLPRTVRLLRAATKTYPNFEKRKSSVFDEWQLAELENDVSAFLILLANNRPRAEHIEIIIESFGKYSLPARTQAIDLLGRVGTREAAEATMNLVRQYAPRGGVKNISFWAWMEETEFADIFFPGLIEVASSSDLEEVALDLLDSYADYPAVYFPVVERCTAELLKHYRQHEQAVHRVLAKGRNDAFYGEDYVEHRIVICRLLRQFGNCCTPPAIDELRRAVAFRDPRVRLSGAMGLLIAGYTVDEQTWRAVAAHPETRGELFDELSECGRLELYPQRYCTQAALAESALVRWLIDDSKLGRPPAKTELVKVVTIDPQTGEGPLDYYVFKFCRSLPEKGAMPEWFAGVAGPYPRYEQPTSYTEQFPRSEFEPIDSKSPAEHVGNLAEIVRQYRQRAGLED